MEEKAAAGAQLTAPPPASLIQPVTAGILAAVVGFASAFTIVLAGLVAAGASPAQAASGLFAVTVAIGVLNLDFGIVTRMPITVAWSTPGAALLVATGMPSGGYAVAVGAFLVAAAFIVVAGIWRPFGRAIAAIPMPIASAMLAGVLLDLCLAPVRAVSAMPLLALPIVIVWALALRFTRLYAIPIAVVVTAIIVMAATPMPPAALLAVLPEPLLIRPVFTIDAAIGIGLPLFLVTMASQNVPGLAVLNANGYRPKIGPIFVTTGVASIATAFFGGHTVNLAAITAALCAGPDAHPDPTKRYIATLACGAAYLVLAIGASFAAAFIAASPPLLIQAVAGLALLPTLAIALAVSLARDEHRLPAVVTFVTTASGISIFGIGGAFWGLVAGGALMALLRIRQRP